jgi:transposase
MASKTTNRFSPEVRTRAVRLVFEHEKEHRSRWATVTSVAAKIGCTAQSLSEWVKKAEIDSGMRGGVPAEIAERLKALERENRELRQANDILRKASAYFAQAELDPSHDRLHRRLSSGPRGRADLQGPADRPVDIPRPRRQARRSFSPKARSASTPPGARRIRPTWRADRPTRTRTSACASRPASDELPQSSRLAQ